MKIIKFRSLQDLSTEQRAVTIGAFDGFHLGHQMLLNYLNAVSEEKTLVRTLITFEPLPHEYFAPHQFKRVMSLRDKIYYLDSKKYVDELFVIPFTNSVVSLSKEAFLSTLQSPEMGMKALIVGIDFKFGKGADGDVEYLKKASLNPNNGFDFTPMDDLEIDNHRISSTQIRSALHEGNFDFASKLLGRPYTVTGKVIHGNQLARVLGAPTINIRINKDYPLRGVFNVHATRCADKKQFNGVANFGTRPTINGQRLSLEIHLHNTKENLYDEYFEVTFLNKLRDEIKFESLDALKTQIDQDIQCSMHFFNR